MEDPTPTYPIPSYGTDDDRDATAWPSHDELERIAKHYREQLASLERITEHYEATVGRKDWRLTLTETRALLAGPFGYYECPAAAFHFQANRTRAALVARVDDVYEAAPLSGLRRALDMPTICLAVMVGEWDGQEAR